MLEKTKIRKPFSKLSARIAGFLLRCFGWRVMGDYPEGDKFIAIAAPHTRSWDLWLALLTAIYLRIPIVFMMKKSLFWWPLSILWYRLGGFPIDREQRKQIVPTMVRAFAQYDRMVLVLTPEGTRKKVEHWKSGFYWIAVQAGVPIRLLWIGNDERIAGMGPLIHPTGNIHADFARIRAFYEETLGRPMPNIKPPPSEGPPPGTVASPHEEVHNYTDRDEPARQ